MPAITCSPRGPYFRKMRITGPPSVSGAASTILNPWMYPSRSRIFAISAFRRDDGTSTRAWRALMAFRSLVSMSAIGSVMSVVLQSKNRLPAALDHAGDLAAKRVLAEAEAAERELAHEGPRAPAAAAAIAAAHFKLDSLGVLDAFCGRGHRYRPSIASSKN